jgi:hypothetical protein
MQLSQLYLMEMAVRLRQQHSGQTSAPQVTCSSASLTGRLVLCLKRGFCSAWPLPSQQQREEVPHAECTAGMGKETSARSGSPSVQRCRCVNRRGAPCALRIYSRSGIRWAAFLTLPQSSGMTISRMGPATSPPSTRMCVPYPIVLMAPCAPLACMAGEAKSVGWVRMCSA